MSTLHSWHSSTHRTITIVRSVACLSLIHLGGCTLIGYGTGHTIDRNSRVELLPIRCDAPELKEGRIVRLTLLDGTEISGPLIESRCDQSALIVRTQRLNRADIADTVRIDSVARLEVQSKNVTTTLTGLGALGDLGIAILILEARSGLASMGLR